MKRLLLHRLSAARGFTLVESIIVLVVLAIAAVTIISLQGNIFRGKADNQSIQVGVQMMHECAEKILAIKRSLNYATAASSNCNEITNTSYVGSSTYPSFTTAVYPYTPYMDSSLCAAADLNCHIVTITLDNLASISLLLVS